MQSRDPVFLLTLLLFGAFIWWRDRRWLTTAEDVLPILAALPVFVWLLWPLRFTADRVPVGARRLFLAAALFAAGVAIGSTLVLAAGWVALLHAWLGARLPATQQRPLRRLLVLPLFAFPWINTDFAQLGWWFRLTGAAAAETVLAAAGAHVSRAGTFLSVNGFQLSVEPACSGLNGLQSLLVAGTMLAFVTLREHRLYWPSLLALPLAAWLANVLRILSAAAVPLALPPADAARWVGPVHSVAGWIALGAMLALCAALFGALQRVRWSSSAYRPAIGRIGRRIAWLELALLIYAGWQCRELLNGWFANPFDRLGWLAFALWLLPLGLIGDGKLRRAGATGLQLTALGLSIALLCLGGLGQLNAATHLGLAVAIGALAPARLGLVWRLAGLCWLPALGWVATRTGFTPDTFALVRVLIALVPLALAVRPARVRTPATALYAGLETAR